MSDRAILFVDGNNWYHALKGIGMTGLLQLDYTMVASKLVGPRQWVGTRYYVGQVTQAGNPKLYAAQRRFVSALESSDPRVSVHFGRLETRLFVNPAVKELRQLLSRLPVRLDPTVYRALSELAAKHAHASVIQEKAVDVMLAVDLVILAERNQFDTAYLLSADGDFTPAVEAVRRLGKKVYAVSARPGEQLASVVDAFVRVDRSWFADCS